MYFIAFKFCFVVIFEGMDLNFMLTYVISDGIYPFGEKSLCVMKEYIGRLFFF